VSAVLVAEGLGKRRGRRWALRDCDLTIPAGKIVGLVGANGAGKSTLLELTVGLLAPTTGTIRVLGAEPGRAEDWLARVGFVAQDSPVYSRLSIAAHIRLGGYLNPRFDRALAERRMAELGLDERRRAGALSGGQRAQLALTLAMAKRPELLVLDEPAASLDPLARRELLRALMEFVAADGVSVIISSHLVADLERVCDHVVVLGTAHVRLAGDVEDLLARHHRLVGPRRGDGTLPPVAGQVVEARHTERQSTLLVRRDQAAAETINPAWVSHRVSLDDLVIAYLGAEPAPDARPGPPGAGAAPSPLEVVR